MMTRRITEVGTALLAAVLLLSTATTAQSAIVEIFSDNFTGDDSSVGNDWVESNGDIRRSSNQLRLERTSSNPTATHSLQNIAFKAKKLSFKWRGSNVSEADGDKLYVEYTTGSGWSDVAGSPFTLSNCQTSLCNASDLALPDDVTGIRFRVSADDDEDRAYVDEVRVVGDAGACVLFGDLFNRRESDAVGNGWYEQTEADSNDLAIRGGGNPQNAMRVRDGSDDAVVVQRPVDTTGESGIKVSFDYKGVENESAEKLWLEYSTVLNPTPTWGNPSSVNIGSNPNWTSKEVDLSSDTNADDNIWFGIRFRLEADNENDGALVDNVFVTSTNCGCTPTGTPETVCNGVDDDCDDSVDEDYVGQVNQCGTGVCANTGTASTCVGGVETAAGACTEGSPSGTAESVCNGVDDDCDGSADEDYVPQVNQCGTGVCANTGTASACVGGVETAAGACTPGTPSAEICDSLDNDCDGSVDENATDDGPLTQDCYTGPSGTEDVGICKGGTQTCDGGSYGSCVGEMLPETEICVDAIDQDCDGTDDLPDETALVTAGEPQYVEVDSVNTVTFCALLEDIIPGAPDDITLVTSVHVVVKSISGTTVYEDDVTPYDDNNDWIACATFDLPAVDVYEVTFEFSNCDYDGTATTILVVFDPDSGFVTGGGWFEYPGSTDRVNFGLVYKLVGKKGTPRGNLLVTRHLANGDICRAKSNGLGAAAVIENTASFSGKGNYVCRRPDGSEYDGAGNLNFLGWVEDKGEPGSHAADDPDRFWIRVPAPNSQLLMMKPPATHAEDLMGGNIQVPQPSK